MDLDLEDFVERVRAGLAAIADEDAPRLPRFLRALLGRAWAAREGSNAAPSWELLAQVLLDALVAAPVELDRTWLETPQAPERAPSPSDGFEGLEEVLVFQIGDLYQIELAGKLRDEWSLLGLPSPSGALWNAFDLFLYLENGLEGLRERAPDAPPSWGTLALVLECGREPVD